MIKRAGTDRGTSSIIKRGQKDTEASITKIVILVLNGNGSLNYFQIQHLDNHVQKIRQNHKMLMMQIRFPVHMLNTEWAGKVT